MREILMWLMLCLQCVKTHLRDMIIVPEMIGSIVGVYNGKTFNQVEIKVTMAITAEEKGLHSLVVFQYA